MNLDLQRTFSYSIAIAVCIAVVRFRKIHKSYWPFLIIIGMGLLSEIFSSLSIKFFKTNLAVINTFGVVDLILWCWQFRRWKAGEGKTIFINLIMGLLIIEWIREMIIVGPLNAYHAGYNIAYAFFLIFLAINQLNKLIVEEKRGLLTNSKFLISTGVVIFYTYFILAECFFIFNISGSNSFLSNIYFVVVYVNLFVNLLYALAVLWIPKRLRFTLPSL